MRRDIPSADAARDVAKRNAQAVARDDAFAVHFRDVEKEAVVVAALDAHHGTLL
jgi:hypothetical protein